MFCHHWTRGRRPYGVLSGMRACFNPRAVPPSPAPHNTGTRKTLKGSPTYPVNPFLCRSRHRADGYFCATCKCCPCARAETDQYLDASAAWETAVNGIDTDIQNMEETFSVLEENLQKAEDALADISAKADFVDSVYFTAYPDDRNPPRYLPFL